MLYILAILLPPVYFLVRRRWMALGFSLAAVVSSLFLLASLFLAPAIVA
jgi:hypothetical protein